jgi:hypothetical protein
MVVEALLSIEFSNANITAHFMFVTYRSGNFNVLSQLSTSFLYVGFKQYGAFGLLSFPLAFGLASNER